MKQVIVRVQDNNSKTKARFDYLTKSGFESYAFRDVKQALERLGYKDGYCIYIKTGNQWCRFIEVDYMKDTLKDYPQDYKTIEDVLYSEINDYDVLYYVGEYLSRF